jgi:hypothetical protein
VKKCGCPHHASLITLFIALRPLRLCGLCVKKGRFWNAAPFRRGLIKAAHAVFFTGSHFEAITLSAFPDRLMSGYTGLCPREFAWRSRMG